MGKSVKKIPEIGEINFFDNYLPKLEAGDYTISAGTTLVGEGIPNEYGNLDNEFQVQQPFMVSAPRFILPANEIHSVYPSPDIADFYDGVMPQVVFRKRVLPWERVLKNQPSSQGLQTPWMALLLFTEDQIIVPKADIDSKGLLRTLSVARPKTDFFEPPPGYLTPIIEKEPIDPDHFNMVDISITNFKNLCPHLEELPYLASVRQVNTEHKEFLGMEKEGWFSMLLSNRLSQTNYTPKGSQQQNQEQEGYLYVRNIVHLVSIEGFEAYLDPTSSKYQNYVEAPTGSWTIQSAGKTYDKIRLASLASWDFYCKPEEYTFDYLMNNLNVGLLQSHELAAVQSKDDAYQYLAHLMEGGYTPLKYYPRQGGETIALYRGPLTPVIANSNPQGGSDIFLAGGSSMIYDQKKGIYDVSYSVAWQIGRLMGLSDSHYARNLMDWKRKFNERIEKFLERYNLKYKKDLHQLPDLKDISPKEISALMSTDFSEKELIAGFITGLEDLEIYLKSTITDKVQEELSTTSFTGILSQSQYDTASASGKNLMACLMEDLQLTAPSQNENL